MPHLYQIALVTHLAGLTTMAGSTLVAYVLMGRFWSLYAKENTKALPVFDTVIKLNTLFAIGILLLILSGVTMMALTGGAYGEQIWFRIKFGLIVAVIINGIAVGRRQGRKLMSMLSNTLSTDLQEELGNAKRAMTWFYLSQLAFFLVIYTLSVFKFN